MLTGLTESGVLTGAKNGSITLQGSGLIGTTAAVFYNSRNQVTSAISAVVNSAANSSVSLSVNVGSAAPGTYSVALTSFGYPTNELQFTVSACIPTIGGVQVNGAGTNTLIAGTNGYVALYGSCLSGATSVQIDVSGVQFTPTYTGSDTQVNAAFQSAANSSGGSHSITVTTSNGTSLPCPVAGGVMSTACSVFVTQVAIQSFTFTNSVAYSRDCFGTGGATAITSPTWPAPTTVPGSGAPGAPLACPQMSTWTGDHAIYAAGNTMAGTATFSLTPTPTQGVAGLYVQGATPASGTFMATGAVTIPAGSPTLTANVVASAAFPAGQTQFLSPLTINWSVAEAGTSCAGSTFTCVAVGASANPVYVALAANTFPSSLGTLMLTYAALAVVNGGATSPATAFANTWSQFSATCTGPANVETWEGNYLSYYPQGIGFDNCALTASALITTKHLNGQCGSFAELLESALALNGISSSFSTVKSLDSTDMVIKNWTWPNTPTQSATMPYGWMLAMEIEPPAGFLGMVPLPSPPLFGDLTSTSGSAGQGENGGSTPSGTPSEKVFGLHFILKLANPALAPAGQPGPYFDPSYGMWYASASDFESKCVAGYAKPILDNNGDPIDPAGVLRFRPTSSVTNITINP